MIVCFCVQANAYVLPGLHVLDLMTKKLGKTRGLLVSQKLVFYSDSPQKEAVELGETLRYIFPENFRSDISAENAKRIHVLSKGAALTVIDGKVIGESERGFDLYKDILLYRNRILLQNTLFHLGVDVSISSLGRFKEKIAYVLGARYPDESVPQIWIEKDTFLPIRLLIFGSDTHNHPVVLAPLDVTYLNWKKVGRIWYPMRIEFYQTNILLREIHVDSIKGADSFPEDLFDITHLKSIYAPVASVSPEKRESAELDEVKKTIENFKKIFE